MRLDAEPENEELQEWLNGIVKPEFGLVDGMVANLIDQ